MSFIIENAFLIAYVSALAFCLLNAAGLLTSGMVNSTKHVYIILAVVGGAPLIVAYLVELAVNGLVWLVRVIS